MLSAGNLPQTKESLWTAEEPPSRAPGPTGTMLPGMATKLNLLTFLQQVQGLAEVARRCPRAKPLGWLALPSSSSQAIPRQRVAILIDARNLQDTPYPVRIVQVEEIAPLPKGSPV